MCIVNHSFSFFLLKDEIKSDDVMKVMNVPYFLQGYDIKLETTGVVKIKTVPELVKFRR